MSYSQPRLKDLSLPQYPPVFHKLSKAGGKPPDRFGIGFGQVLNGFHRPYYYYDSRLLFLCIF